MFLPSGFYRLLSHRDDSVRATHAFINEHFACQTTTNRKLAKGSTCCKIFTFPADGFGSIQPGCGRGRPENATSAHGGKWRKSKVLSTGLLYAPGDAEERLRIAVRVLENTETAAG
jgi:hypothetical protein